MNIKKIIAWMFFLYFLFVFALLLTASNNKNWNIYKDKRTQPTQLPDLTNYQDPKNKKRVFFEFLTPVVKSANASIQKERGSLLTLKQNRQLNGKLKPRENRLLAVLCKKYKVKKDSEFDKKIRTLELRVNSVPSALVLTQAANESAWGTSRFAVDINNLFGQWCFKKGCGLVPKSRSAGAKHEVQRFATIYDAVEAYLNNINTHRAYRGLRKLRQKLNEQGQTASAHLLAGELTSYSERGDDYVNEIRQMIRSNKLE